eukprot:5950751-Pyramimonas_sp.AAC.1
MELYYLELYKVDPLARRQYCGRSQLRGPQLGCYEGSKPYPTVADPSARWWGTVANLLDEPAGQKGDKRDLPRARHLRDQLRHLAGSIPSSQIVPLPARRRD